MQEPKPRLHDAIAALDDALVELPFITAPGIAADEVLGMLSAALQATYQALASAADFGAFQAHLGRARDLARGSLALLQAEASEDPAVDRALTATAAGFGALMEPGIPTEAVALPGASTPPAFRASLSEPRILGSRSEVLFPRLPLQLERTEAPPAEEAVPVPVPPKNLEELRALTAKAISELASLEAGLDAPAPAPEDPPAALPEIDPETLIAEQFGLPVSQQAQRFENARQCFLDLSTFGCMRRPRPTDRWASGERTERRLLCRLDAIALCDDHVATRLVDELAERPMPDPELTWGAIMLFGSLWGEDAVDQAVRVANSSDLSEPGMVAAIADAFSLCANGGVVSRLEGWLDRPDERRQAIALSALGRRQTLTAERWGLVSERLSSGPALLGAAEALEGVIGSPEPGVVQQMLRGEHEAVTRATLRSLLRRRSRVAQSFAHSLRNSARVAYADAALVLALSGDASTASELFAAAQEHPSPQVLEALGWAGSLAFVPFLIGHLQDDDVALAAAALRALQRLTAAGLDGSEDLKAGEGRKLHDHYRPHEAPALLCADPEHWMAWWTQNMPRAKEGERYRHGHPWSIRDNVEEIRSSQTDAGSREWAVLELGVRSGRDVPLPLRHFVSRQTKYFQAWVAGMDERSLNARGWPCTWAQD